MNAVGGTVPPTPDLFHVMDLMLEIRRGHPGNGRESGVDVFYHGGGSRYHVRLLTGLVIGMHPFCR